ncbi:DUF1909-domain-containing protein [Atractiella rhizophila]|nr:DUF1909-domain-containing protein [Atractiella rhizophila]
MGNGNKAAMKREKNAKDAKGAAPKSQLKSNEAAKNIQCKVCFATFLSTSNSKNLTEHASNKHSKTLEECFPSYTGK